MEVVEWYLDIQAGNCSDKPKIRFAISFSIISPRLSRLAASIFLPSTFDA